MMQPHHSTEKLQKLMGQLLTKLPEHELKQLQKQYDELEVRATAEEMNKMEKLLHTVVSADNLRRAVAKPAGT